MLAREAEGVSGQGLLLPPPPTPREQVKQPHGSSVAQLTNAQAAPPGPAVLKGRPARKSHVVPRSWAVEGKMN